MSGMLHGEAGLAPQIAAAPDALLTLSPYRFLIAVPDPAAAYVAAAILAQDGACKLDFAYDHETAVTSALMHDPDIVLIDMDLGRCPDGIDTGLEIVRHVDGLILYTGTAAEAPQRARMGRAPFFRFVPRPMLGRLLRS
ncbi:MAG TPA: hypothetical protein VEH84_13120, partial [Alphaproteobacteria bacterium]|nr:hypothetical protein [Alphaproteobacteria bacterium]